MMYLCSDRPLEAGSIFGEGGASEAHGDVVMQEIQAWNPVVMSEQQ